MAGTRLSGLTQTRVVRSGKAALCRSGVMERVQTGTTGWLKLGARAGLDVDKWTESARFYPNRKDEKRETHLKRAEWAAAGQAEGREWRWWQTVAADDGGGGGGGGEGADSKGCGGTTTTMAALECGSEAVWQ